MRNEQYHFLKGADTSHWEVLKMNEPGLEKAMDTLQYLSGFRGQTIV
ncbi:hypothetical protein [Paenibacillus sp. FSL M7-0896]